MSPTITATKTKTVRGTKRKSKSERAEVNRQNAQKSTGPTSAEGKARCRFNALTHGMTAESTLLPGEDASEFKGRLDELLDDLQPRNRLEEILIERINRDDWLSIRAERAAAARVAFRLRHDTAEQTREERDEVLELGHRLLHQLAFPLPISLNDGEGALGQAPLANLPGDLHHPARLTLRLESTLAGCDWLLDRWAGLKDRLEIEGLWTTVDGYEMVRLMGRYVIDMARSHEVQFVALASLCIAEKNELEQKKLEEKKPEEKKPEEKKPERKKPDWDQTDWDQPPWNKPEWNKPAPHQYVQYTPGGNAPRGGQTSAESLSDADMIAQLDERAKAWCQPFARGLEKQASMRRLAPANVEDARQGLSAVIELEVNRIHEVRAELERIAVLDEAEAAARLAFETGAEGDRQRRYVLSRDRLLNRTVDTFLKVRTKSADGAFDPVDFELADRVDLDDADRPSESDPVVDIAAVDQCGAGDSCNGPAAVAGEMSVLSLNETTTCDGECILRNEAGAPVIHHGEHGENEEGGDIGPVDRCVAGDSGNGPAEFGEIAQGEDESITPVLDEQPTARSPVEKVICDDERILRNEAGAPDIHHGEHCENEASGDREPPSVMDDAGKRPCLDKPTKKHTVPPNLVAQWHQWREARLYRPLPGE